MPGALQELTGSTCWIFSDGKAGNDAQTLGVANALGLAVELKSVAPHGVHRLLSPWIGVASRERFGEVESRFAPPWPRIAMSIGRLTTPYIRALKRRAGAATFTVILQDPKVPLHTADLFWVPEHDKLRGANVVTTLTAPHSFSPRRLATLRQSMPETIAALPQPRVAVLLGGSNGDYVYSPAALQRLKDRLTEFGQLGAGFMVTPSRRSDPALVASAKAAVQPFPHVFWDMTGANPYPHFLACADVFLAPADSINMTGEPCATGRPVYVFHPDGGSPKFARFHRALQQYGATRAAEKINSIGQWNYKALDSAPAIAAHIAERMKLHLSAAANDAELCTSARRCGLGKSAT
ncbi:MAG TPA: mitochondrial fission ELM1 family protein [Hyphomicrobium sp.]|nr:mitochondrial fission ELM1 family protein [Hyphomicrobium sp.]